MSRESSPLQSLRLVTLTDLSHLNEAAVSVLLSFRIISCLGNGIKEVSVDVVFRG